MRDRRQFLIIAGTALGLAPIVLWLEHSGVARTTETTGHFPLEKTDEAWRAALTPQEYRVLRGHATERPFTSPLNHETRAGTFNCAGCGQALFDAATKYDSGTGWPSFWRPLPGAVGTSVDRSLLMVRTEVHCSRCGGHLGHVFPDGPPPTGERYCMNGAAMHFVARG